MTPAESFIWALVCGLPPGKRERRPIFMLRAYIDDSESSREPPIFILAGYVTHAETWAKFSKEWQMALDMKPRIAYFKMREALAQHGEFHNWSQQLSYERIAIFRQIIERFNLKEFAIRFRIDEYQHGFASMAVEPHMKNPFFFASDQLFLSVARNLEQFGLPRVRMDVIFDNRVMEKDKFLAGWEWASKVAMPDPPDLLTGILLNAPYFQNDKEVLPLQAADMHATYVRLSFEAAIKGQEPLKIPGFTRLLRGMLMTWDETQFRQLAESDIRHMRERGLL